jgi:hypothetical protein
MSSSKVGSIVSVVIATLSTLTFPQLALFITLLPYYSYALMTSIGCDTVILRCPTLSSFKLSQR